MQEPDDVLSNTPGPAPRRGKRLPPIQTTFTPDPIRNVQRPPPVETVIYKTSPERPPPAVEPPVANRRASRNFLGLFNRSRSVRDQSPQGLAGTILEVDEAKSPKEHPASIMSGSSSSDTKPRKSASTRKERPQRSMMTWDPLPLFQAYSQAVKHSTLPAPTVSADAILRIDKQLQSRRKSDLGVLDSLSQGVALPFDDGSPEDNRKLKRGAPGTVSLHWTTKIFVLTASGFLLQYAGSGHHDRLPEKIMQLTSDSAAFASDAIPGKHWVLQVSTSLTEASMASATPSKSVFSKLAHRNESKRCAMNFLLVMESAEDMDSWLVSVRKEIQSLGGQSYRPDEIARKDPADVIQRLQQKPSRRFLIQRTPDASLDRGDVSPKATPQEATDLPIQGTSHSVCTHRPYLWHNDTGLIDASKSTLRPAGPSYQPEQGPRGLLPAFRDVSKITPPESPPADRSAPASLLKWELPSNFTPSFSGIGMGLASGNDLDPRRESMSSVPSLSSQGRSHRSLSEHSDAPAPNFSVPTFSQRFTRSARSGSIVTPPTSSGNTYRGTSPVSPVQETPPGKDRSGAGELPTIVTSTSWVAMNDASEAESAVAGDPSEWEDAEELQPAATPSFTEPHPKRLSSLGNRYHTLLEGPSEDATPEEQDHFLSDLPSPRRHSAMEHPPCNTSNKAERLSHLPPPHPPPTTALPPIPSKSSPCSTGSTSPKLRRPTSMQIRPSDRPQTAVSRPAHSALQPAIPMTVRERRSFMGRPPVHVLGPPTAPPPSAPLPQIPQFKPVEEKDRAWRPSTSNTEPIKA